MLSAAQIWTQLENPKVGQQITVPADAQVQGLDLQFDPSTTVMTRSGDNLVFKFEDGATLTLLDFYATYSKDTVPDFHLNGTQVAGLDFLSAFGDDFIPAAMVATPPKDLAARFHNEGHLDVLGGIDFLGHLKQLRGVETPLGETSELAGEFTEAQLVAGEFASLVATAPQPGILPQPVVPTPPTQDSQPLLPEPPQADRPVVDLPQQPAQPPVEPPQPPAQPPVQPPQEPVPPPQQPQEPTPPPVDPTPPPVDPPTPLPGRDIDLVFVDRNTNEPNYGVVNGLASGTAGNDRVYIGIHTESANQSGLQGGRVETGDGDDVIEISSVSNDGYSSPNGWVDVPSSVNAGTGNDTIKIGAINGGTIDAGAGDDTLHINNIDGFAASTVILGGAGTDTITVNAMSGGTLDGGDGNDTITIGTVSGHNWNSLVLGGAGNDTINVTTKMSGGTINGGEGDDTIIVTSMSGGIIDGGEGFDTFIFNDSRGHTLTLDNAGKVIIDDGTLYTNTVIEGFEGLGGGDGNDTLYGNNLDNVLAAGRGNNILTGGGGSDTFLWKESDIGNFVNTITDFRVGEDKITMDLDWSKFDISSEISGSDGKIIITDTVTQTEHTIVLEGITDQDAINRVVGDITAITSG